MITSVINDEGRPVEVAPGRGDLRRGSQPFTYGRRLSIPMVDRSVSFAHLYRSQPMVAMCVGWLLRQSWRVPLKVYRRTGDESRVRLRAKDHKLAAAIEQPWERGGPLDLTTALLAPYLVHGNSTTELESGARESLRFRPSDWRYALPIMPWRDRIAGWELDRDDPTLTRMVGDDRVLHIKTWSPLGPIGISPLEQLGVTIAIEDAAQRHTRESLRNGVRTASAIQATAEFLGLDPAERKQLMDQLREDVTDIYAGPENSGRPVLLPPGLEWKAAGQTAQEAQLIQQREVDRIEAVGVYGITPGAIGVIERGSQLNEQRQMAYQDGLAPPMIWVESALNAQVAVALLNEPDVYVEYDFSGILRGDRLQEIEAIRQAVATAVLTPNEGRAITNQPRSDQPGMDDFYLPRNNLWPLSVPYPDKGMGGTAGGSTTSTASGGALLQDAGVTETRVLELIHQEAD